LGGKPEGKMTLKNIGPDERIILKYTLRNRMGGHGFS